jgi:lambda repressor-like predicted transcriptional regulator
MTKEIKRGRSKKKAPPPAVMRYEKWITPMHKDELNALIDSSGLSLMEISARLGFMHDTVRDWTEGFKKIPHSAANCFRMWWKLWNIHNFSEPNPIRVYYRREYPKDAEREMYCEVGEEDTTNARHIPMLHKIYHLRCQGYSLRQIGDACGMSHQMVKNYLDKNEALEKKTGAKIVKFDNSTKEEDDGEDARTEEEGVFG